MRKFLTRVDRAKSHEEFLYKPFGQFGNPDRYMIEFEGRHKFMNPSSSERRRQNIKTEAEAKKARAKLGVDNNLIPLNFRLGGGKSKHRRS